MHPALRYLLVSLLIWLIPFVVSLFFFERSGQLRVNFWLFKAVMALVLSGSALGLFRWFYGALPAGQSVATAALLGLGALAINVGLDAVTVIPLARMSAASYAAQIGSLYLLIVLISVYAGATRA